MPENILISKPSAPNVSPGRGGLKQDLKSAERRHSIENLLASGRQFLTILKRLLSGSLHFLPEKRPQHLNTPSSSFDDHISAPDDTDLLIFMRQIEMHNARCIYSWN
jgi:hypothetical protein